MKLKEIKDPWIAKEKFDHVGDVKQKVVYEKWTNFIDLNRNYFTWVEDTNEGKNTLSTINNIPAAFREGIILGHTKAKAYAKYNNQRGFYEIILNYNHEYGVIGTTFQKEISIIDLKILFDMSKYLDAYLLNNGNQIIDEKCLENLSV